MNKRKTIIIVGIGIILLLISFIGIRIFKAKGNIEDIVNPHPAANLSYGGEPVEFESFKLSSQGTTAEKQVYEANKTENGIILEYYLASETWDEETSDYKEDRLIIRSIKGDDNLYQELCALLGNCQVDKWNGFSGSNPPGVLDGSSMSFEAKLLDGTSIVASGSNNFPSNYGELKNTLFDMTTKSLITSNSFNNGHYEITLPDSWVNVVNVRYAESYVAFFVKRNNNEELTFFIIDDSDYGYYQASNECNLINVGRLQKDDETRFITVRDLYELEYYKDNLSEEAVKLIDTYSEDRQAIIDSLMAINDYTLVLEDGTCLYEADARDLFDQAKGLWLNFKFAGEYAGGLEATTIDGKEYRPIYKPHERINTIESLKEKFLEYFSSEFTDEALTKAQETKELIEYNNDVYVSYNKMINVNDFGNYWVDSVKEDNGNYTILVKLRTKDDEGGYSKEETVEFKTERNSEGRFVFTEFPFWGKTE